MGEKTVEKSFLYLLPEKHMAEELAQVLTDTGFDKKKVEIWKEINLLELTLENGSVYVEDFEESLRKEDEDTLSGLGMQQVYSVTYPAEEAKSVREIMQKWMASFGGKLGSDTEDFAPFLTIEEL
ncbi:MAG: hypothetical protein MRZ85_06420 [Clostridium sp.]|jgi:hypothetical protein|nr:hypothetical protein [Clostridium sp.]MDD6178511.1 hypothetical protein [Clostridium sp.]